MAEIKPFKGIRYNTQHVDLKEVITEPYDRIPPALQEKYYHRNPLNVVRIILGKDEEPGHPEKDKYRRAKIYLDEWLQKNILIREDRNALYLYEQEFLHNGKKKKRLGFIARVKLEKFQSRKVLPHEKTFPKHKADRLNLLRATNTNTEQIFLLYKDDDKRVSQALKFAKDHGELVVNVQDEDRISHRMWVVKDQKAIENIQNSMKEKVLIIADGHHRYETSLNYQQEMKEKAHAVKGDEPFNSIMMTLFCVDDAGLVVLPTFRLVKSLDKLSGESFKELLSPYFSISEKECRNPLDHFLLQEIREHVDTEPHMFAAYIGGLKKFFLLRLKSENLLNNKIKDRKSSTWKRLDVSILHSLIIEKLEALSSIPYSFEENVSYIRNLEEGLHLVSKGDFQMIFFLKPVSLHQIRNIVENGELMPHKSTDFFPKLKSGLVMNPLED